MLKIVVTLKALRKLFLVVFLFPLFSIAQSNYKPGYVVTLKGDTLHGFIDYRGWDANPTEISFKPALAGQDHKQFTINDITFFSIDDLETYKKYTCKVSKDITEPSKISGERDTSFKIETVFLKILQKGKNLALYSFTDDLKTRFYIGEAVDYTPKELEYKVYRNSTDGSIVNDDTYLKTLFALASKYAVLNDDLAHTFEKASYSESDLLNIVSKINNISKREFKRKYDAKTKIGFFSSLALNIAATTSSSSSAYSQDGGGPHTSYLPAVSLGVNIVPNTNTDKVEFRAELLFSTSQFNNTYKLLVSPYVEERASYNQTEISIIPQIIYNFYNAENLKVFLGLGFAFINSSYSKAFFGSQNPNVSDQGIGANDPYLFLNSSSSFYFKGGVKIKKKWEIFINYKTLLQVTQGPYFALNNTDTQIGLAYFWGK